MVHKQVHSSEWVPISTWQFWGQPCQSSLPLATTTTTTTLIKQRQ